MNKVIPTPEEVAGQLYLDHFGVPPDSVTALPLSGSDRRYYRLAIGKQTAIATFNANVAENNTYFYFTELFRKHGIPVPEVYRISKDRRAYLQQDVGHQSLFDILLEEGLTDRVKKLYIESLVQLAMGIAKKLLGMTGVFWRILKLKITVPIKIWPPFSLSQ